jgi:hypothetical protein
MGFEIYEDLKGDRGDGIGSAGRTCGFVTPSQAYRAEGVANLSDASAAKPVNVNSEQQSPSYLIEWDAVTGAILERLS